MSFNKKPKTINPNEVDPSVYYYDEVYDEMKDEEESKSTSHCYMEKEKDTTKSSKYIQGLLETAEFRKTEKELRKFKRNFKDREEAEKSGLLNKEDVYVTSTYKKKLKEYRELEKEKINRLEKEKDNSMNFLKNQAIDKNETLKRSKEALETKDSSPIVSMHQEGLGCQHVAPNVSSKGDETSKASTASKKIVERSLKSLEDRREYLRELLAKRTTGKAYDDAFQRYLERKSRSQ